MAEPDHHGLIQPESAPRAHGGPQSISQLLDRPLESAPGREILVGRTGRYTASELDLAANRAANALASLGVSQGDRVAMSLPNDAAIVVAFLGSMRLGAIWMGINSPLAAAEKAYMLADAEVGVFVGTQELAEQVTGVRADAPQLREVLPLNDWESLVGTVADAPIGVEIDPLAPAAIAYTSGTTGFPKGAVHSQHNLLLPGAVPSRNALVSGTGVLGVPLPLSILNLMILGPLVAFQNDSKLVCMDRVDGVGMAEWISAEGVTTFAAVPAMVHDLLTNPAVTDEMLRSLDAIGVGGADMPDAFRRLYEDRFGVPVGTGYGLTEAPTAVTTEDVTQPLVPNSCGKALPQCRIVIVDSDDSSVGPGETGEVCVTAASDGDFADCYRPMLGYWNRPDASAEALRGGILHTGDIGVLDSERNLRILDRKHDLIIRGGANVYPAEVERVLHDDPRVAACAVVGMADARLGERVVAFVELEGSATADEAELRAHCAASLARYKVPDEVRFVASFDRTPMGKIRKGPLRERLAEPLP